MCVPGDFHQRDAGEVFSSDISMQTQGCKRVFGCVFARTCVYVCVCLKLARERENYSDIGFKWS